YYEFRFSPPVRADFSELAKATEAFCPFCPDKIEVATPRFPEEFVSGGRIRVGEAVVVPNLMPYSQHSAVTVVCRKHFVGLTEFTQKVLADALSASQEYFKKVVIHDKSQKHFLIVWNFMPPSGGSMIHPHLQPVSYEEPMGYYAKQFEASRKFYEEHGRSFWQHLVEEENLLGERYVGATGSVHWLTAFAPRSYIFEVIAVFPEKTSILELDQNNIEDFTDGLVRILKYMDTLNISSFNLILQSGSPDEQHYRVNASIIPRFTLPPLGTSDVASLRALNDLSVCYRKPETTCTELKQHF
ncbi:MAG: hypothetical protein KIH01_00295, partial [Candidatus Freyarchaeota archaeon]|nr:hypothetical protein [Candidatus Jordarchaeia archaeon]